MEDNYKILELFPTPLFVDSIPLGFEHLIEWFDSQEMIGQKSAFTDDQIDWLNYGSRSKNTYILDEKECVDFKNYILSLSLKFGQILGYPYEEYKLTQSWLSWKLPGQQHQQHVHANSFLSGVFYYGHYDEDTPSIEFHKNINSHGIVLKAKENTPNPKYPFTYLTYKLKATPGMIVLFPSGLIHSVPINDTSFTRKSIAFNIVPKEGFGSRNNLTELKF